MGCSGFYGQARHTSEAAGYAAVIGCTTEKLGERFGKMGWSGYMEVSADDSSLGQVDWSTY